MSDETTVAVERQSPEGAFGLLSNGLRVSIIRTLGGAEGPMSFSALREATSERDSGKFNYHLGKLTGHFVTKNEDGYRLSLAGIQVYGAIQSGAYTANASLAPFEFDGPCPLCGSDVLLAEYSDEHAKLYCPNCDAWRNEFSFPPASLDQYAREELPYAFDRWMHATVMKVLQGFCSNCGGRVDGRLEQTGAESQMPIRVLFECGRCGDMLTASAMLPALFHPVAVSFFEDHDINVLHDPSWRYFNVVTDWTVEVASEAPLTARVSIKVTGGELAATIGSEGDPQTVSIK
ncbi:MAG: hypothetical protein ABEJ05_10660 [Haloglomus sp.]